MHATFHGAAGCVTGSRTLLEHNGTRVLIDCGSAQGADAEHDDTTFPFDAKSIDAVVLTHGHLDHCGEVPSLFLDGFRGPVCGHAASCDIAKLIWEDSVRIGGGLEAYVLPTARKHLRPLEYHKPFTIGDIRFTLYDAGHILGSSHILAQGGGKSILFSGDIGPVSTPILRNPQTVWYEDIDAVVIESTYGDRNHRDRLDTIMQFCDIVTRTVERRGVLIVPAFAIGRTQEMLYHLNTLVENDKIPAIPVFVDSPMAGRATEIYTNHPQCYDAIARAQLLRGDQPLAFRGLNIIQDIKHSYAIADRRPPFMVIAGSGMCTGGRILRHLETFLPRPETTVMIVGWQARGTPGRALVDGAKQVTIEGKPVRVAARVETLNGFSAHADKMQLLSWATAVRGDNKRFFVNHGEPRAARELARELERLGCGTAVAVEKDGRLRAEG